MEIIIGGRYKRRLANPQKMGGLIVKLLGLADLLAAAFLFFAGTDLFPIRFILTVAAMLMLKGLIFLSDPVSRFDIIIGFYLALTLVFNIKILSILFGLYIGFKGLYSMF